MIGAPNDITPSDISPQEIFGKILSPISFLGEGEWGMAWLVSDEINQQFTLKSTVTKKGINEAAINRKLKRLVGFEINPDDENSCALLLQHIPGKSIKALISPHIQHVIQNEFGGIEVMFNEGYLEEPIETFASGLLRNITLALGATKALARLHAANISHGDVDFANYVVSNSANINDVQAIDFGLSKDISKMDDRNKIAFAIGGDIVDLQVMLAKMLPALIMQPINELYDDDRIPSLSQVMKTLNAHLKIQNTASDTIVNAYNNLRAGPERLELGATKNTTEILSAKRNLNY
jgi:tRNA A-37 threonylcarbamoyl transferase component Bud32